MSVSQPTETGAVTLRDGRRLAWSAAGPREGTPVLYLHGAIGSPVRRTPELDALIGRLRIRYIAVSRPGFGRSDPCPGRSIASFPADLERLADRLGIGRFAVVGVSAGGPYAISCARAIPERAAAVAAVSCLSPLGPPHASRTMPAHIRLPLRLLAARPELAERAARRMLGVLERHPRALDRVVTLGATPADRRLLANPEMRSTAVDSFLAAAAGGARGMIDDYLIACAGWGFDLREVSGPVHVWHGARDRYVPVEHARLLAAALPNSRAWFDPDDGHFFFRRRLAEVLESLVAAVPYSDRMCRNIRTLHNFDPPANHEEVHASALQYVRKISGYNKPSQANAEAFQRAVDAVTEASLRLLDELVTTAPPKDREVEAAKARERSARRYAA